MEAQDLEGGDDTVKVSWGQGVDQGEGGEWRCRVALQLPFLLSLDSSWTVHNVPLGFQPPGLGQGGCGQAQGLKVEERGRARTAVWKGMEAAAAASLPAIHIPTAGFLGKNTLPRGGLCLARPPLRGSRYQQALKLLPWPTSCHLPVNRC